MATDLPKLFENEKLIVHFIYDLKYVTAHLKSAKDNLTEVKKQLDIWNKNGRGLIGSDMIKDLKEDIKVIDAMARHRHVKRLSIFLNKLNGYL